jgi:RNase P subunit RPR2
LREQQLLERANKAVEKVDAEFLHIPLHIQALLEEGRQFVQLVIRTECTDVDAERLKRALKSAFTDRHTGATTAALADWPSPAAAGAEPAISLEPAEVAEPGDAGPKTAPAQPMETSTSQAIELEPADLVPAGQPARMCSPIALGASAQARLAAALMAGLTASFKVACSRCGEHITIPFAALGCEGHCPHCRLPIAVNAFPKGAVQPPGLDLLLAGLPLPVAAPPLPPPAPAKTGAAAGGAGAPPVAILARGASKTGLWVKVVCTQCGKKIRIPVSAVGRSGHCPGCHTVILIGPPAQGKAP